MNPADVKAMLQTNTFLGALPGNVFEDVHRRGRFNRYGKGDALFTRGDAGGSMMLIVSGTVKVSNTTIDGREAVLNFLGAGDEVGEITVLDGLERTATAVALEPAETFVISRRDLMPALEGNPAALKEIVDILCAKLRITSALVEDSLNEMAGRTAHGLLRLANQHGKKTKDGIMINLPVSQRDLGAYFGLSRENTSRQLGTLSTKGIIRMEGTFILVRDPDALSDAAGEGIA